jgi:hypothetical protein
MSFTRKWQGKIQNLKEIARISVTYTMVTSLTPLKPVKMNLYIV